MSGLGAVLARSRALRLAAVVGSAALVVSIVAAIAAVHYASRTNASSSPSALLTKIGDASAPTPGYVAVDRSAPAISLPSIFGHGTVSDAGHDEPLLVNFWSSSCDPCRRELPVLAAAAKALRGTVGVLGVDTADANASARSFARVHGATYPNGADPDETVGNRYRLTALPTTFFLSADRSHVVAIYFGAMTRAQLIAALRRAYGITW